jgi:Glutamine synthetase adenylyltransferase
MPVHHPSLVDASTSRYYTRWTQADPARPALVAEAARQPMDREAMQQRLARDLEAGLSLPAAMRRLRNLIICSLITRDLDGRADLAEVVATMTGFADFAVQTHLAALMQEQTALHGTPLGEESGRPQEMIVLGMGKLGGVN